jgi:hypothetical protein
VWQLTLSVINRCLATCAFGDYYRPGPLQVELFICGLFLSATLNSGWVDALCAGACHAMHLACGTGGTKVSHCPHAICMCGTCWQRKSHDCPKPCLLSSASLHPCGLLNRHTRACVDRATRKCQVFTSVGFGGGVAVSAVCVTNTSVVQLGLSVCRVVLLVSVHVLLLAVLSRSLVRLIW